MDMASISCHDDNRLQLSESRCNEVNTQAEERLLSVTATPSTFNSVPKIVFDEDDLGQGRTDGMGLESKISSSKFLMLPSERT